MPPTQTPIKGKKRSRDGKEKVGVANTLDTTSSQRTPTCAQPPREPSTSSAFESLEHIVPEQAENIATTRASASITKPNLHQKQRPRLLGPQRQKQKLPRLPENATITKRPIHHPSIPSPFSSSASPKTIYIKLSSPFVPCIKRIRSLLTEISKRRHQSVNALKSSGRLNNQDVEAAIAEGANPTRAYRAITTAEKEAVYVKATGRAIEKALEVGVWFQQEKDCHVKVEMGSVSAIDDIEIRPGSTKAEKEIDCGVMEGVEQNGVEKKGGQGKWGKKVISEEGVPETRIRTLSAITIAITLK